MRDVPVRAFIQKFNTALVEHERGNDKPMQELTKDMWYDWFCKKESLFNKTISLGKKVVKLSASKKIDLDTHYVWFKNNCPMDGNLYDDIRFSEVIGGDVVFTIVPRSGQKSKQGKGEVWGKPNHFKEALVEGKWSDLLKWMLA